MQQSRQGDREAEVEEYIEVIRVALHYVINILVHIRAEHTQGVQARQRGVETEQYKVAHVLAKDAGTQEEAVMVSEVKALPAKGAVLRGFAHVALTSLAMPEFVGRVVRWRRHIVHIELLTLALLLLLLLLLGYHAAQIALYLPDLHWIRLIADPVH